MTRNYYRILKGKKYKCFWCIRTKKLKATNFPFISMPKCNNSDLKNQKFHVECEYEWCIKNKDLPDTIFLTLNRKTKQISSETCRKELLRKFKSLILMEI